MGSLASKEALNFHQARGRSVRLRVLGFKGSRLKESSHKRYRVSGFGVFLLRVLGFGFRVMGLGLGLRVLGLRGFHNTSRPT